MKAIIRLAAAIVMATALSIGFLATPQSAEAKTVTISKSYTAPRYGQTNSGVKALQYRLNKAGVLNKRYITSYYGSLTKSAVKKFQSRNGLKATGTVNRTTWTKLVKKTGTIKVKTSSTTSKASKTKKGIDRRCLTGRAMCADKSTGKLRWIVNGKVKLTMDARFGCSSHPTRNGSFKVYWKSYNHTSSIYHTWMPRAMFFSGGQAVHYSPDFAARGYNGCSHGCVNIRNWSKINTMYKQVRVGDKVVVYRS